MCGIVGAIAQRNVVPILIEGLKRLEYRGYDSAGIAIISDGIQRMRTTGRVAELEAGIRREQGPKGNLGVAHTRWATHGAPTEQNAHPHVSGDIAVVHNGIIENYEELRRVLTSKGYLFQSETDTEVIAHLIQEERREAKTLLAATQRAVEKLKGAYAIGVVSNTEPDLLICARKGSPLLIGIGIEENFIASDASALLPVTQKMLYLEEGDVAALSLTQVKIYDGERQHVERPTFISELSAEMAELDGHRHFMQKEIHEQPRALADTLEGVVNNRRIDADIFGPQAAAIFSGIESVTIIACGTSYHAAQVARYWIESLCGVSCVAEVASEYRYRDSVPQPDGLVVAISQSGETADTLAALAFAKSLGHPHTLAICNVAESALVRQASMRFLTHAGPEIGVASTKAFTTQLAALYVLALALAKQRGRLNEQDEAAQMDALRRLPARVQTVLNLEPKIAEWAKRFADKHHALFLGRGMHYPIAMEGALKLKEISYIHAEAYPAGELKHGPLALVDSDMPVVAIAPNDALLEKLKSNLQEVRARGGELYVFADEESLIPEQDGVHIIKLPDHAGRLSPILHTIPLQLLAYHAALNKGTDVDKPRNLAKSVTVE